ncbi:MAG: hypothetical protein IKY78_08860 [Clostridia bacterium]|nr:hypothetical protein [Clostridia bacterium]
MLKKSLSLVLVILMAFSFVVTASAADEEAVLTETEALAIAEVGVAALVAEEGDEVTLGAGLADVLTDNADTPEEISRVIGRFVFIEEDKVEELSDAIIADSVYTVKVIADGKETVYVAVDTVKYPEIYDARVFLSVVDKLLVKCDEVAAADGVDITSDNYNPMSYNHIAGELALHMMLADATDMLGANSWNSALKDIYDRAALVNLNVDEARFPQSLMSFLGWFVTFIFNIFA